MKDKRKAVLVRHMPNCLPVAMAIIEPSKDPKVTDQDEYMRTVSFDLQDKFMIDFPEFRGAAFYTYILEEKDIVKG